LRSLEIEQLAMCVLAVVEILFLYKLAREVNQELKRRGDRPITRREYGWKFLGRALKEHERLFPDSSKRTWWVLIFVLSVIGFIVVDFLGSPS
jgi:hypothetical protein